MFPRKEKKMSPQPIKKENNVSSVDSCWWDFS